MAILYPPLETILNHPDKPTEGELHLIKVLTECLNDSCEIYFQPFLNGDRPDIIVLRENCGAIIFEVKDWELDKYAINDYENWIIKDDESIVRSPINQVLTYKQNLYNLHSEDLYRHSINDKSAWAAVNCAVYFHRSTQDELSKFFNYDTTQPFKNYVKILGNDSVSREKLFKYFDTTCLNKRSYVFDNNTYKNVQRLLKPPFHSIEDGIPLTYSNEQKALIEDKEKKRRKIKGVAGSGKTYVLAKLAVNAHKRTNSTVLVLTFNLALKNFIHDKINEVREDFDWNHFYITNFHQFFKAQANNQNLTISNLGCFDNPKFFDSAKSKIKPFKAIFIDEIQDYKQAWIDMITKYFTDENTELVVFGDEKQNIYERELDENREPVIRTIAGQWNKSLNKSFRMIGSIANLAAMFQNEILSRKYMIDSLDTTPIANQSLTLNLDQQVLKYYYCKGVNAKDITDQIYRVIKGESIHSSDVAILATSNEMIRNIHDVITENYKENTTITFETNAEIKKYDGNKMAVDGIRRQRKNNLKFKTGTIKLSSVHSFKGWEMHTIFLLIGNNAEKGINPELIYTGITRARYNLIILNIDNPDYHQFFQTNINDSEELISSQIQL